MKRRALLLIVVAARPGKTRVRASDPSRRGNL